MNTASCTAISSSKPRLRRPPISLYSPSTFSRTTTRSIWSAPRTGEDTPGSARAGRTLANWRNARRIGISSPQSDTWSGTPGQPTAPSSTASYDRSVSIASSGIIAPVSAYLWHDQSKSSYSRERSYADAAASRTDRATVITSWPIPSPGMTATRWAPAIRG